METDVGCEPGKWSDTAICSARFAVFDGPCSAMLEVTLFHPGPQALGPQVFQEVPELRQQHLRKVIALTS